MKKKLSGISVPRRKGTLISTPSTLPSPRDVTIPMLMHVGRSARVTVREGERVRVGTLIGEADGTLSANIHSSISGMVTEICDVVMPGGRSTKAVRIASDGECERDASVKPPVIVGRDDFIRALRNSGIVGLGGAGFPTHVKYDVETSRLKELIINAAECEPYITSDTCTLTERGEDVAYAVCAVREYLGVGRVTIGVERGNGRGVRAAEQLAARVDGVEALLLQDVYPQGAEKVLIYHVTGRVTPVGRLPIDVGCIVSNISTIAEIGRYLKSGMPAVERCITVDGGAVREPQNLIVPVGTRVSSVFEHCGGFTDHPVRILYGGPMMGVSIDNLALPVLKNTNALIALTAEETCTFCQTACIRCGSCLRACPFFIDPAAIARARKRGSVETVRRLRVDACMECGCCAYVCPAKLPLVESNRLAKALIMQMTNKEERE